MLSQGYRNMQKDATWVFMRHFAKKPHPLTFSEEEITEAARSSELAGMLVEKWDLLDREDVSLSNEGIEQAYRAAMRLPEYLRALGATIDRIFTSPYQRTYESAEIIRRCCFSGAKIRTDERLTELRNGVRNIALTFDDACALWPEYAEAAHTAFLEAAPPFGESHAEAREGRARSFLADLKKFSGGSLVVTHAGFVETMHQIAYGTADEDVVRKFSEGKVARFGSILVCSYDRAADRIVPITDDLCLHELS